jgi:hypothetical protein
MKCAEWNRKNRAYFQEIYLRRRLEELETAAAEPLSPSSPVPALQPVAPLEYPREVVQEVIGAQQLVIIEYLVRLLVRGVQEVIRLQVAESQGESERLPLEGISRGDGRRRPP